MKGKGLLEILLTLIMGFLPFFTVSAQNYKVSPSSTSAPSQRKEVTYGSETWMNETTGGVWIKVYASTSGSNVTLTAEKSSGTFLNAFFP